MKRKRMELSRRAFLKGAAALTAAPYIIPASALGGEGRAAPSERIVMGGIGIGGRGSFDLRRLSGWDDVQFVAVSDPRVERRDRAKEAIDKKYDNQDCKTYIDFREMLVRDDIDAVLIATSDRWHSLASIWAFKAGKDVYCEKPCSMSIVQGRAMADAQRRYGRVYQAGTQRRSEEAFVFIFQMARTGMLGKIHTITVHIVLGLSRHVWHPAEPQPPRDVLDWDLYLGPAPWRPYNKRYMNWHNTVDLHTGGIGEWGSHTIDMAQRANDSENTGPIEYEFPNNDTGEGMVCQYANGVKLVFKAGKAFPGTCGIRIEGSEGWAECSDGYDATFQPLSLAGERQRIIAEYQAQSGRPLDHWRDFLDCVKSRRQAVAPAETAHRSVSACHAATICMELRRNVKWDPAKEAFVGDEEANGLRSRPTRAPWRF